MDKRKDSRNAEEKCVDMFETFRPHVFDEVEATYADEFLKRYTADEKMGFGIMRVLNKLEKATGVEKKKLISMFLWRMFTQMYKEEGEIKLQQLDEHLVKGTVKRVK
jgi:hypothetical protein